MSPLPAFRVPPSDGVVRLREWRMSDVPEMALACRDPEIARWTMVPDDYTEADARGFVAGREDARGCGESLDAAVVDAGSGALLGAVALTSVDWRHERGEVGYWVARWARGRGVAVRAVRLLSAWTFEHTDLGRLDLMTYVGNVASERVAERAGFTREGVLRAYYLAKRGRRDVTMFGLVRPGPPAAP
jgi:RimJ/RimL family protein N-acetyltransferase